MNTSIRTALAAALALTGVSAAVAPAASAGTITGTIRAQAGGAAIASAEVRVWHLTPKGWRILSMTAASAAGGYSLTVPGGMYLVDARGPAMSGANWGDRWYDVAPPNAGGYVGQDADVLTVGAAQTLSGIDLSLEVLGGADGTVMRAGNVPLPNAFVRMERRADVRIHHNDLTKTLPAGLVSMRGLPPAADYQVLAYDPTGLRETLLANGPYTVTSNANGSLGNLVMVDAAADPYEGNNAASCAVGFDAAPLHLDPPQPWQSQPGARLGPTSPGNVDWYCFTAVDGDRLFVSTSTDFTWNAVTRPHPWTDPMISFWRGARGTKLAEDDDSGTGPYDARVDTGPLPAGCHCIAVAAFGDSNYVGASQGSAGRYALRVVMGNRPPVVSIKKGASEVPAAPAIVQMDEGDLLDLTLGYTDADHDVPSKSFTHVDSAGAAVAGGMLNLGAGGGTYRWTAPAGSQVGSPYVLRLVAGDGEFTMEKQVLIVVNGVNRPPGTPVPVTPIGDDPVMTGAPTLTWSNAADPEAEPLRYDVELYLGDTDAPPVETATVDEAAGMTSWTPSTLPENTRASWRVRARDGHPNGLSPWSPFATFLVDVANDAPDVPVLVKPAEGEVVTARRPGLSALDVLDPEDDDVDLVFQLASDRDFAQVLWTSDPVPMDAMAVTTMAASGVELPWGGTFHARVRALDDRGAMSAWSEPNRFRLTQNVAPTTPSFAEACVAAIYTDAPPAAIVVTNVVDHEREPVTFEVQFFPHDASPETAIPVYRTTAPMDTASTTTAIPVDLSGLPNATYRYRVRAHDGTSPSDWIDCELTLDVAAAESGGCCDAGGGPAGGIAPLLVALGLGGLAGRRRRRRSPAAHATRRR